MTPTPIGAATPADWSVLETVTLIALFAGPVLAVLISRWQEEQAARRRQKERLFLALMTTRAHFLSYEQVNALNAIDVVFYRHDDVRSAWKRLVDHLNTDPTKHTDWGGKRADLMCTLLSQMAKVVGYRFDESDIHRQVYSPRGFLEREELQQTLATNLSDLLSGRSALWIRIAPTLPSPEENSTAGAGRGNISGAGGEKPPSG